MVKTLAELPQIIHEAFYIAGSGRPGPVLVDVPKDVFIARGHYEPVTEIHLPGYKVFTEGHSGQIRRAAQMMWESERPDDLCGRRHRPRQSAQRACANWSNCSTRRRSAR